MGPRCLEACPEGYFGVQCEKPCHPVDGCTGKSENKGRESEIRRSDPESRGFGVLSIIGIVGISVTTLIIVLVAGLIFSIRKGFRPVENGPRKVRPCVSSSGFRRNLPPPPKNGNRFGVDYVRSKWSVEEPTVGARGSKRQNESRRCRRFDVLPVGDRNVLPVGDRNVLPVGDRNVLPVGDRNVL
ncbi:unnamed protein product, partial [Darwinula stevensoni]